MRLTLSKSRRVICSCACNADNDDWNIESPISWPAQVNNVRRLLSILKVEADALSDTADVDLAALGLQQPKASMRFNGIPLLFGATNNIGGRRYVMLDEKLYLLPDVHLVFVNQGLAGLVDRRLLPGQQGIVSVRLPDLELRLDKNQLWRSNQAIEFSQASLLRLVDNWRDLQATRISNFDLELPPRQLIEIELADGEVIEFLLMSEDPEIIIAHPKLGLQYHFRRDYRDQLITLSVRCKRKLTHVPTTSGPIQPSSALLVAPNRHRWKRVFCCSAQAGRDKLRRCRNYPKLKPPVVA